MSILEGAQDPVDFVGSGAFLDNGNGSRLTGLRFRFGRSAAGIVVAISPLQHRVSEVAVAAKLHRLCPGAQGNSGQQPDVIAALRERPTTLIYRLVENRQTRHHIRKPFCERLCSMLKKGDGIPSLRISRIAHCFSYETVTSPSRHLSNAGSP